MNLQIIRNILNKMSELKKLKKSSKSAELAKQQSVMEWPTFLDENLMDVIKNDFKFTSMTPVQSVVIPIFSQVKRF